jgi:hypothetical protein
MRDRAASADPQVRASQEERERVVETLRTHAGEGRLELDELEQRVEAALGARTRGELQALTADLPAVRPTRGRRARDAVATVAAASALLPLLAGVAILAFAPAAFAWVGWTALGWWLFAGPPSAGLGFARCGHGRRPRNRGTVAV